MFITTTNTVHIVPEKTLLKKKLKTENVKIGNVNVHLNPEIRQLVLFERLRSYIELR